MILFFPQLPDEIVRFRTAFASRQSDFATEKPDQAIERAMDIVATRIIQESRKHKDSYDRDVALISNRFLRSISHADPAVDDFHYVNAISRSFGDHQILVVTMGKASRTILIGPHGKEKGLAQRYDWVVPWMVRPLYWKDGILLLNEYAVHQATGMDLRQRVIAFDTRTSLFRIVGYFEGDSSFDDAPASIKGNLLTIVTRRNEPQRKRYTTKFDLSHLQFRQISQKSESLSADD